MSQSFVNQSIDLVPDANDSSLILGFDMKPKGNLLLDYSAEGNNGSIASGISHSFSSLGHSLNNKNLIITVQDDPSLDITTSLSVIMTVQVHAFNVGNNYLMEKGNNYEIGFNAARKLFFFSGPVLISDTIFYPGRTYDIGFSHDSAELKIYVNGLLDSTQASTFGAVSAANLVFFDDTAGNNPSDVRGYDILMSNEVKPASWFESHHNQLKSALWKTSDGVNLSTGDEGGVSGDHLSNSPFRFGSSTFRGQIKADTINGQTVKVLECTSVSGTVYVPTSFFHQTPTEAAFGKIEFYFEKPDAEGLQIPIIADSKDFGSENGYRIDFNVDESVTLNEMSSGTPTSLFTTAAATFASDTKIKCTITRANDGEFTVSLDDIVLTAATGSNPVTDLTYTTSTHIIFGMGVGTNFAMSDNFAFTKTITF